MKGTKTEVRPDVLACRWFPGYDPASGNPHADSAAGISQVAAVNAAGRVAVQTGGECIREAGHVIGEGFSCQANMMLNPGVADAMAGAFTATTGPLTGRLLAAPDAAETGGGDIRGRQSAAIKVVAGRPGEVQSGRLVDLRVDVHAEPLAELRRLVELHDALSPAVADGPARLAELGRGNPEGWFWHGVALAYQGHVEEAKTALKRAFAFSDGWRELFGRIGALLPNDPTLVERLSG